MKARCRESDTFAMLSDVFQTTIVDDIHWPVNDVSGTHDVIAYSDRQMMLSFCV